MLPARLHRKPIATALRVILVLAGAFMSGCLSMFYERELFATGDVQVVHSEQPCSADQHSAGSEVPNADLLRFDEIGLGYFVATQRAWEVHARQLATEVDGDIVSIRLCDGVRRGFKHAQLQVWRTRGFVPTVREPMLLPGVTLEAPPGATYGARLKNIFDCLEESHGDIPLSAENKARLVGVDATRFFATGRYFPGYAKVDRYIRPTSEDALALSMIVSDRLRADHEARVYLSYPIDGRSLHAAKYLVCLLDRGYRL